MRILPPPVPPRPDFSDARSPLPREAWDTQVAAAEVANRSLSRRMLDIFDTIKQMEGATDDELQVWLGLPGNSERPARQQLQKRGLIYPSRDRRPTRKGNPAIVWRVL